MHLDSDDLLALIRKDFPYEYELATLRMQVELLTADNERLLADRDRLQAEVVHLSSLQPSVTYSGTASGLPYAGTALDEDVSRHAG